MRTFLTQRKAIWWVIAFILLTSIWALTHNFNSRWTFEDSDDSAAIEAIFEQERSGVWVNVVGKVTRLLSDDNKGSRHQRFILELESGHTLMIAHNIDLAVRIPLVRGDRIALRGQYEWNHRGGVVHWTHHDPAGKMEGGWIDYNGQRYR